MMTQNRLGIDLGGTKIEAVVLDSTGKVNFQQRIDSPSDDYDKLLQAIRYLVLQADKAVGEQFKVGIGGPGAISPQTGLLKNANTLCLNGKPLVEDLQRILQRPVRIANDANCLALSEAMDGAAADYDIVFGVIVGTGTGGALVCNKQLIVGPHAIAGEWGHNPLPWQKPFDQVRECYCGKQGCIETFLSGPGFAGNVEALTGLRLSSREIVARAEKGDEVCQQQMEHYYDQFARALAHVINIIDPEAIVLGGGMSNIDALYKEVPARLNEYVFSDVVLTRLLPPKFGDASGVRGAAWLW
jgi:fructokinase